MRLERDGSLDGVAAEAILRADEGSEVRADPRIGNSNEPEAPSAAPGWRIMLASEKGGGTTGPSDDMQSVSRCGARPP